MTAILRLCLILQVTIILLHHQHCLATVVEVYESSLGGSSGIEGTTLAAPFSDSSTGVARFQHVFKPQLETYIFSNGRHESSGLNSFVTVDMTVASNDDPLAPFRGATEKLLDPGASGAAYTWVSTYTQVSSSTVVRHYALFSGGNTRDNQVFPSQLYSFDENQDGTLQPAVLQWSANPNLPARFALLVDLGAIPQDPKSPNGPMVSVEGSVDIVIAGFAGIDIYSQAQSTAEGGGGWTATRYVPIIGSTSRTYVGVDILEAPSLGKFLVIVARSPWSMAGEDLDAPCFIYDYRNNALLHPFAAMGQTVSVAVMDDNTQMMVGAGGQNNIQGQPNLMYKFLPGFSPIPCELAETQLVPGAPATFQPMEFDDILPTPSDEYATVALSGLTKTRQVIPFRIPGQPKDYILEVNIAQPSYIYCRNSNGETFRIIPLPGSEGLIDVFARAADILVHEIAVYVVLAMNSGENLVYSVNRNLLLAPPAPTTTVAPTTVVPSTHAPTTNAPSTATPTTGLPTTPSPTTIAPTTPTPTTVAPTTPQPTVTAEAPTTKTPTAITDSPSPAPTQLIMPTTPQPTLPPSVLSPAQALPQQKDAPLEPKCGSVASSAGYGGVGGQSKGCDRIRNLRRKKRIRGR
ncbi:expressed unknown protein [Seminavis robusta]|uniref:Uncharacterized protein n=1 Tax=Seminavis robusta TaxID=568900 RepID=A0A9N8DWG6_9STRA|nr:expressed unknown protein [Seminavis robusta]|eukprot:Sro410_g137450.1 n/a (632) ;mRNA; r:51759-53654